MGFHEGELAVQERAGVRQMAAKIGNGIHQSIPPAAAEFLAEQRLAALGWSAPDGAVWASLICGPAGWLSAPGPRTIAAAALPAPGDPLGGLLRPGLALGMLVIDPATRRRMRANGVVSGRDESGWSLLTDEVYSNCPKYIQARQIEAAAPAELAEARASDRLDAAARALIAGADTFFIASARPGGGADASHRGGNPGFVRLLDERTLLFPDYRGNMMFNTLGNLAANPRAGLLFVDWERGATLQLSGAAEILWDDPAQAEFAGAERLVRFRLHAARSGQAALAGRLISRSPFNPGPAA